MPLIRQRGVMGPRAHLGVLLAMVVVAGCGGGGQATPEAIVANASTATVGEDVAADAGYGNETVTQEAFTDTGRIAVSGDIEFETEYRLRGTAWSAIYRGSGSGSPSPVFALLAVPQVRPEAVDVAVNPLRDRSPTEIATRAQDTYGDIENVSHIANRSVTILGNETAVPTYEATATVDGQSVAVVVHLAMVRDGTDIVTAVAIHPEGATQGDAVVRLLEAIEH